MSTLILTIIISLSFVGLGLALVVIWACRNLPPHQNDDLYAARAVYVVIGCILSLAIVLPIYFHMDEAAKAPMECVEE